MTRQPDLFTIIINFLMSLYLSVFLAPVVMVQKQTVAGTILFLLGAAFLWLAIRDLKVWRRRY